VVLEISVEVWRFSMGVGRDSRRETLLLLPAMHI
jgi:hypothetical protein